MVYSDFSDSGNENTGMFLHDVFIKSIEKGRNFEPEESVEEAIRRKLLEEIEEGKISTEKD